MAHGASGQADRRRGQQRLSIGVFTLVLAVALWLATGSLLLGVADGGPHPTRRLLVGVLLVALTASALWRRRTVCAWLRARPWLVVPLAVAQLAAAAVDGLLPNGPYLAFSMTSIGLAVVVARPSTVWLTVAVLELGYALAILAERSPAELARGDDIAVILGAVLGFVFVALVGLGVVVLFRRFVATAQSTLEQLRGGGPALTPALTLAIERGPQPPAELPAPAPAPAPVARLTAAERRVVEGLADGSTPKQLALRWGVSIATVRTHIKHAKRKTHARTLSELSGMARRVDWPEREDDGG